jgi:succinoglycan biosynthesis protein ExoV
VQLYCWQGDARNFGDELNRLIWPRLLAGFFDDDAAELFLGIGSVLDARHAPRAVKIVAGAGYGGYQLLPTLDASWVIHWVRGPRTAHQLGLSPSLGLGDPAMLLCHAGHNRAPRGGTVGFMPHFESLARGAWWAAAELAGIHLIDPRGEPDEIIASIKACRVLLSEALHGVIVADTLRVPWIALEPLLPIHRAKWHDWADTLGLEVAFHRLVASSPRERLHLSRLPAYRVGRRLLSASDGLLERVRPRRLVEPAALALAQAAAAEPQLSDAAALDRCQARMLARIDDLRRDPRHGVAGRE